jgi:L-amino acid N-acyltransferase YncA
VTPESKIRPTLAEDVDAITSIYNEGIEDRVATFETRPRALPRSAPDSATRPLLVAEARHGAILGFARVSPSERAASASVGEHAVHVAIVPRACGCAFSRREAGARG